jgi:uncharacterized membrane protein (DUF2068 family)
MDMPGPSVAKNRPPAGVLYALGLMAAEFAIAIVRSALMKDWTRPAASAVAVAVLALICILWLYGLWRRKVWLWWVTVIGGVGGCILTPWSVGMIHDSAQLRLYLLQVVVVAPAMLLLLLPASRRWYRHNAAT